jgi:prepilin-type N-terminal cleavage/methylation domain-containing protein
MKTISRIKNLNSCFLILNSHLGFTLIELLVSVTISTVMVALGIAAYNNFNESQTLELATRKLKGDLWATQTKAVANKQPLAGCTTFEGYKITLDTNSYTIAAWCDGAGVDSSIINLPTNVQKQGAAGETLLFKPRTQGTDKTADFVLIYEYTPSAATKTITITPTGEIR